MHSLVSYIRKQDVRLFFLFNHRLHCLIMDIVMNVFTQMGSFIFACLVPVLLLLSGRRELGEIASHMALILVTSQVAVHLVKRLVNRPRPFRVLEDVIAKRPPTCKYSFPSGHTCAAFALAFPLASSMPGIGVLAYSAASLVGLSRIYLGAHYPSDVLVGYATAYAAFLVF